MADEQVRRLIYEVKRVTSYRDCPRGGKLLRGCPPKNRPLNSDQNFDFLQNFSTKQGSYKVKEFTKPKLAFF